MPNRRRAPYRTSGTVIGSGGSGVANVVRIGAIGRPNSISQGLIIVVPTEPGDTDNENSGGSQVALQEFSFYPRAYSNTWLNGRASIGEYSADLDGIPTSFNKETAVNSPKFSSYFSKQTVVETSDVQKWDPDLWSILQASVANGHIPGNGNSANRVFAQAYCFIVDITGGDPLRLGNQRGWNEQIITPALATSKNGFAVGDIMRVQSYHKAGSYGANRLFGGCPGTVWVPGGSQMFTNETTELSGALSYSEAMSLFKSLLGEFLTSVAAVPDTGVYNSTSVGQVSTLWLLSLDHLNGLSGHEVNGTTYNLGAESWVFSAISLLARKTSL